MSDFTKIFSPVIDLGRQVIGGITGSTGADAAIDAAEIQQAGVSEAIAERRRATESAQGFLSPFAGAAGRGLEASNFLANPQAQFEFLQSNPLFNFALENANRQTNQRAASRGRLSAGDTLQQLSNNVLLSASPLIDRQREDVTNLLKFGGDIATSQANIDIGQAAGIGDLITSGAAAGAAGEVGRANALTQGAQNIFSLGSQAFGAFSDVRLKTNIKKISTYERHNWYTWEWNDIANTLGLQGSSEGVLAHEAQRITPNAVVMDESGYLKVKYGELNGG